MDWMEIVHVRAASECIRVLKYTMQDRLKNYASIPGLNSIELFETVPSDTDLVVILDWNNEKTLERTQEGFLLAEYFEQVGLVTHKIMKKISYTTAT